MKKLLFILFVLLVAFVAGGFFLPTNVHVERSVVVARPPATVFALLNGFRSFNRWSPWMQADPNAEYRYSGPDTGVGARMTWSGDPALVGEGWQEIVESVPNERVAMHLDFGTQGVADSAFTIEGDALGSRVTWQFDTDVTEGQSWIGGLLGRYFGLFLDDWVGADFEQGLASFRTYAESLPAADFSGADIRILDVEPVRVLSVSGTSSAEPDAVATALARAYRRIVNAVTARGLEVAGQPMAVTRESGEDRYVYDAVIPVAGESAPDESVESDPAVREGRSPGGPAVRIVHVGPYEDIGRSYDRLAAYMAVHGLERGELSWEHYISDPSETPADEIITHVYVQIRDE